jgi:spermidine/putrescine transport system permease protein
MADPKVSPTRPARDSLLPWRNPWRKPYFLAGLAWLYVAWSLLPVLLTVVFSFNDGRSMAVWNGFTTDWYCCGGDDSIASGGALVEDPALLRSLRNSLLLGALTTLIAVPVGSALALGTTRWRSRVSSVANGVSLVPLVTPELVLGSALYVVVVTLYPGIGLGMTALVLGHATFSISYVLLMVRARLASIGDLYELAAQDLGASPLQAVRTVLLPLLTPVVIASGSITFAVSLDDFVTSNFLFGDGENITVPLLLYSATRVAPTPVFNALSTVLLVGTLVLLAVTYVFLRYSRRGRKGSALDELASSQIAD